MPELLKKSNTIIADQLFSYFSELNGKIIKKDSSYYTFINGKLILKEENLTYGKTNIGAGGMINMNHYAVPGLWYNIMLAYGYADMPEYSYNGISTYQLTSYSAGSKWINNYQITFNAYNE